MTGAPRNTLPLTVQSVVGSVRFIPVVETSIEGKRAKVALESPGFIGPVRVSLSNRSRLDDRCMASHADEFVACLLAASVAFHPC